MTSKRDLGWWMIEKTGLSDDRTERMLARLPATYTFEDVEMLLLQLFPETHLQEARSRNVDAIRRPGVFRRANVAEEIGPEGSMDGPSTGSGSVSAAGSTRGGEESTPCSEQGSEDGGVEEALERELEALQTVLEETSDIENEGDRLDSAVEQMQEALVTMRLAKRRLKDKAKDRGYKGTGKGDRPPRRDDAARSANAAEHNQRPDDRGREDHSGAIARRKRTSTCNVCGFKGHWGGDAECRGAREAHVATVLATGSGGGRDKRRLRERRQRLQPHLLRWPLDGSIPQAADQPRVRLRGARELRSVQVWRRRTVGGSTGIPDTSWHMGRKRGAPSVRHPRRQGERPRVAAGQGRPRRRGLSLRFRAGTRQAIRADGLDQGRGVDSRPSQDPVDSVRAQRLDTTHPSRPSRMAGAGFRRHFCHTSGYAAPRAAWDEDAPSPEGSQHPGDRRPAVGETDGRTAKSDRREATGPE